MSNTGKDIAELNIACLGLAFKSNIDDLRESPALLISQEIASMGFGSTLLVEPILTMFLSLFWERCYTF